MGGAALVFELKSRAVLVFRNVHGVALSLDRQSAPACLREWYALFLVLTFGLHVTQIPIRRPL
jgi:hypothetical protein